MAEWLLGPQYHHLTSEHVLVQAWKKAHRYIRYHNWFEDALALDVSSVHLRNSMSDWAQSMEGGAAFTPDQLRIVPAPKSSAWHIKKGKWAPLTKHKPRLRPLAHATVRDQTLAVALMMCLADIVETAQGDPRWKLDEARARGMVSYGNRLYCEASKGHLCFRWGNSGLYRQFFQDYVAFINRSRAVITEVFDETQSWAELHLDLSEFYDRVKPSDLQAKIRSIAGPETDERFLDVAERLLCWRWHEKDANLVNRYADSCNPQIADFQTVCLPQGLVASGFFANLFMLDFDGAINALIAKELTGTNWKIVDYCRYVDDMRLVIDLEGCQTEERETIGEAVSQLLQENLDRFAPNQLINPKKTEVIYGDSQESFISVADSMRMIQKNVSGPLDIVTARNTLEMIEGLLATKPETVADFSDSPTSPDETLRSIFNVKLDVRDETLARFSANRWKSAFRSLRPICEEDEDERSDDPSRPMLDGRAESFARTMVRRWIDDPSNVRLLRIAFDLFPNSALLKAVIKLLQQYIGKGNSNENTRRICLYVASELFRAGASETGMVRDNDELPIGANLEKYRERLATFAEELLKTRSTPWYLEQQALLFLACARHIHPKSTARAPSATLSPYASLHFLLAGELPDGRPVELIPLILVLNRITGDTKLAASLMRRVLASASSTDASEALTLLLTEDSAVSEVLWEQGSKRQREAWRSQFEKYGYLVTHSFPDDADRLGATSNYALLDVVASANNPLGDEFAALVFLGQLTKVWMGNRTGTLTPQRISLECNDWSKLNSPAALDTKEFLTVQIAPPASEDSRYSTPGWCAPENSWRLEIGQILRVALAGDKDFTRSRSSLERHFAAGWYRGIKSNWLKRRYGLFNGRGGLGADWIPVTPWLTELLSALLAWPGQRLFRNITGLREDFSAADFSLAVEKRSLELKGIYGRASETPVYEVPVTLSKPEIEEGRLRVALVQTVLPREASLKSDPRLNDGASRRKHQRHLSAVLKGLQKMLQVRATFSADGGGGSVDLVVLPELSVHPDDIRLLLRFIDQTKCIVFCGLVFHPREPGSPELINSGLWLIPDRRQQTRSFYQYEQGKRHLTSSEKGLGIVRSFRPCQWVITYSDDKHKPLWRMTASICYDATDLRLAADLRDITDAYVVSALNKDVGTFDSMVAALHYHMFQHIILVNSGEYGGSTVQAPFKEHFERTILQHHGNEQAVVSFFEISLGTYSNERRRKEPRRKTPAKTKKKRLTNPLKTPPAGYRRWGAK
jgi:Reverse transcriptase (RNA-dependent DNA polymerase)